MDNIIKNPILIAVVAGVIVYAYITWKNNSKKKNKDKINALLAAGITTAIVWLIAYGYLNYKPSNIQNTQLQKSIPTYKLVNDNSESPKSFTLINPHGGISAPFGGNTNMPDIFINPF
jgi:hypothetical protein